jgi:hypothetical protein
MEYIKGEKFINIGDNINKFYVKTEHVNNFLEICQIFRNI